MSVMGMAEETGGMLAKHMRSYSMQYMFTLAGILYVVENNKLLQNIFIILTFLLI